MHVHVLRRFLFGKRRNRYSVCSIFIDRYKLHKGFTQIVIEITDFLFRSGRIHSEPENTNEKKQSKVSLRQ